MAESKKVNHGKKRKKRSVYQERLINKNKRKIFTKKLSFTLLFGFVYLITSIILTVSIWYSCTFDITFNDLLFTMLSSLEGTGESTLSQIFGACTPPVIISLAAYVAIVIILWKDTPKKKLLRRIGKIICLFALCCSIIFAIFAFRVPEYLGVTFIPSKIYEEEYVDPETVKITDKDNNAQNLICIYLESMETTYASVEDGGEQPEINYIPNLTAMAEDNISFSDSEELGGFRSITGTGWTMGALMGTTGGVPFSLAVFGSKSHNSLGRDGTFANGLTTLGDILAEKGYTQEFLCGSDASFAGRDTYFKIHGNYEIFDYNTAIEEKYVNEKYKVWWGIEDQKLFNIAKKEITELANGNKPFNFTMLTVDTHHVGGYRCALCPREYETKLENVIKCQDRQIAQFIEWCKKQDFYENTTIVILGDHPRMDTQLVTHVDFNDRTMYNCFINSAVTPKSETTMRTYTSLDVFPTLLAAMGFEIEGDKLGLGTNLFSSLPTLCEEKGDGNGDIGYNWLDEEVSKTSSYYKKNFITK